MRRISILLVEDNPGDVLLTQKAIEHSKVQIDLAVTRDGEEALAYLHDSANPMPDLILLDLNLPKLDGRQVLKSVKQDDDLRHIPVIVLTSSEAEEDITAAYREYCCCYISKPIKMKEFVKIVRSIEDFWFTIVKLPKRKP